MNAQLSRTRPRWVAAMYEFLADRNGEAPLRQVAEHGAAHVPPGPAWREGRAKRETDARYRGADGDMPELEKLRVIRTGAKRIALKSIYHERKVGRLVRFEKGGRPWLRAVR